MSVATIEDIRERIAAQAQAQADDASERYEYVKPLIHAANSYVEFCQNPDGRLMTGLHDLDVLVRGFGPGDMVLIIGQTHQGKTQLALNTVFNNRDRRVLWFSPDEVSHLMLSKLMAMRYGVDVRELEERIKRHDADAIDLVRSTTTRDFPSLLPVNRFVSAKQMRQAKREAEDFWQAKVDLVVFDFLELLTGYSKDDIDGRAQALKQLGQEFECPIFVIHQGNMDRSMIGKPLGIFGGRYGGQNEATHVACVYRRTNDASQSSYDRQLYRNQVSVEVSKNKLPPCDTGSVHFYMSPKTAVWESWRPEHAVANGAPTNNAATAVAANNIVQMRLR